MRDMPASATNNANTRLRVMTTSVSSTVSSRPPRSGPMCSTATWGLKSSNTEFQQMAGACVTPRPSPASRMQREHHEVAVGQAVLLQDGADLPIGPDFRQGRGVGGTQRAVFLADAEPRHAVAAAADDVLGNRNAPQRQQVVVRILAGELEINDIVFEHRVETALVQALQLIDFRLELGGLHADAAQVEIGGAAGDAADFLALQVIVAVDLQRIALRNDHHGPIPPGRAGEADDLDALGIHVDVGGDYVDALRQQ